jgi:hypothetical protein
VAAALPKALTNVATATVGNFIYIAGFESGSLYKFYVDTETFTEIDAGL